MTVPVIIFLAILIIYIIINLVIYLAQDKFIYHPEKLPLDYKFNYRYPYEEVNLKSHDGYNLNGIHFKKEYSQGVIIYFHNHSGNIGKLGEYIDFAISQNYDFLAMDYRGYGKSEGSINESNFYTDAQLWYDFAKGMYPESKIVLFGRSFGGIFASKLAVSNQPKLLMIESAVFNLKSVAINVYPYLIVSSMLKYQFDASSWFDQIQCKILLVHGRNNRVVPFSSSLKLQKLNPSNTELVEIEDGNHFNLISNSEMRKVLYDNLQ